MRVHTYGSQSTTKGISSQSTMWVPGMELRHQLWWQAPLPTEPCQWLQIWIFFKMKDSILKILFHSYHVCMHGVGMHRQVLESRLSNRGHGIQ